MKSRTWLSLGATAVIVLIAGVATAQAAISTTINFRDYDGPLSQALFTGDLSSPKSKCLPNRTVKLFKRTGASTFALLDQDQTSTRGAWAVKGNFTGAPDAKIVVTGKKIGKRSNRKICARDSIIISAS